MGNFLAKIAPNSQFSQAIPPTSTYDPVRDIPDLTGKVTIVTGGNSGIGYHTVKQLLLKNAKVYLAARSLPKAEEAKTKLKDETGGKEPVLLKLDLADLKSVRTAAEEFLSKEERLDILFNNAGLMVPPTDLLTAQGYDIQFGTNVLGHYFFTKLLLPALERSTSHFGTKARVIHTSSSTNEHAPGPTGIDWKTLKGGPERDEVIKQWGTLRKWKLYGASKLGNILVSNLFVRHHGDIVVTCTLHPGGIRTELQQHITSWQQWISEYVLYPAPYGAWTQLWAGTSPEGEGLSGKHLFPWARVGKADPRAANEKTQDELLKWMEEQIKGF